MKPKSLLVLMTFMLCLAVIAPASASPTMIYLDPIYPIDPLKEYYPGDNFTVTLKVDAVSDMYLWVATIEWDPTLLNLVEDPVEGDCLKDPDGLCGGPYDTSFMKGTIEPGKIIEMVCTRLAVVPGADVPPCTDDLASMKFRVKNNATYCTNVDVSITFSDLLDSAGETIPHDRGHGRFHVIPELPAAILGLGAMLGALVVYGYRRRNH